MRSGIRLLSNQYFLVFFNLQNIFFAEIKSDHCKWPCDKKRE